jgi:thiamine kinase-like enzyme
LIALILSRLNLNLFFVHGDAKLANFCFCANGNNLAAVDFQYVGRGAGIKDLMYFLGSCLNESELALHADNLFDEYFSILKMAIEHYHVEVDFTALETEWRDLLPFAWADFERFLIGWATTHYKLNAFTKKQTIIALSNC